MEVLKCESNSFVAFIHNDLNDDGRKELNLNSLKCCVDEVHRAFTLPLTHFYDTSKQNLMQFRKTSLKIPVYDTETSSSSNGESESELKIWGLTAFILHYLFIRLDYHHPIDQRSPNL